MKYKYVIFSPYFGRLPNNFNLWLMSCSYNTEFKFIVFTDDTRKYDIPSNVEIKYLTFLDFKNKIQEKFNFKLSLETPYKLCDFKPTYGFVFGEYIKECEYWGYCDLDLIFGDLKKFLPEKICDYDKISFLGHFCMYKNDNVNDIFMKSPISEINYIDILSNNQHFGFDEIGNYGINNIFKINGLNIFNYELNVADINCRKEDLYVIKYVNEKYLKERVKKIFIFDNGKIYSLYFKNKKKIKEEYAYIHLQKRKMTNRVCNLNKFIIIHNSFVDYINIDESLFKKMNKSIIKPDFKWISFRIRALKNRSKRFLEIYRIQKGR